MFAFQETQIPNLGGHVLRRGDEVGPLLGELEVGHLAGVAGNSLDLLTHLNQIAGVFGKKNKKPMQSNSSSSSIKTKDGKATFQSQMLTSPFSWPQ